MMVKGDKVFLHWVLLFLLAAAPHIEVDDPAAAALDFLNMPVELQGLRGITTCASELASPTESPL